MSSEGSGAEWRAIYYYRAKLGVRFAVANIGSSEGSGAEWRAIYYYRAKLGVRFAVANIGSSEGSGAGSELTELKSLLRYMEEVPPLGRVSEERTYEA